MALRDGLTDSGFLVVKRFEAIYREFAADDGWDREIYALPLYGTEPHRLEVRYRGLDREALSAWPAYLRSEPQVPSLAEIRLGEVMAGDPAHAEDPLFDDSFLADQQNATDVLAYAELEHPGVYEIVWARIAGTTEIPPQGFAFLGYEPAYFWGQFSPICDALCFPRWHGTDPEGTLFLEYFERLNANGLFDDADTAARYLAYYLSFEWTETGDYEIAEVWAPPA